MTAKVPIDIKKARGTYQPAKEAWKARQVAQAAADAPKLPRAPVPPPPEGLSAEEARWWPSLARAVDAVGVYTEADEPAFRQMVRAYALAEAALDGRVYEEKADREGVVQVFPIPATIVLAAMKESRTALGRFGLDPAARNGLVPAPIEGATAASEPATDPDDMVPLGEA